MNGKKENHIVFTFSWTNERIMIRSLPYNVVNTILNSNILNNSLPGLNIYCSENFDMPNENDWLIDFMFGTPSISYELDTQTITYYYKKPDCIEHDLLNVCLQIVEIILDNKEDYLLLHANAIIKDENGVMILGAPLSGKTTLSIQAINSKWSCLAGERLILDVSKSSVVAGTTYHNLSKHTIKRYFPSMMSNYFDKNFSFNNSLKNRLIKLIIVVKVTETNKTVAFKLSKNMLFRYLMMDIGSYIDGRFYLHYYHDCKIPGESLDTIERRSVRGKRITAICEKIPTHFLGVYA